MTKKNIEKNIQSLKNKKNRQIEEEDFHTQTLRKKSRT